MPAVPAELVALAGLAVVLAAAGDRVVDAGHFVGLLTALDAPEDVAVRLECAASDNADGLAYCLCHGILSFVKRLRVAPLRPLPFHRLGFGSGFLTFLGASLALARLSINQFHPRVHFRVALAALLQGNFFPLAQNFSIVRELAVRVELSHLCFPFLVFSLSLSIVYLICSHLSTLFQLIFTSLRKPVENSLTCGYQNVTLLLAKKGGVHV